MYVKQETWDFLLIHQTPGFGESLYSLAHCYLKIWAGEEKLHANSFTEKYPLYQHGKFWGKQTNKQKSPFCLFAGERLEKTKKP